VNLASRLTSIAPKDAVLVDGEMAAALEREGSVPPAGAGSYQSVPPGAADALSAVASVGISAGDRAPVDRPSEQDRAAGDEPEPSYRFALQPMWRRPVRGLGLVEPWLLTRRPGPV
jgi:adenylate cyclase